ncbi:MAG: hypothetical protein CTY33_00300 [Methylotenera sp.]|nr:MAG: hypothetical protein CTY33_00300 [Methylotenera sp.]
MADKLKRTEDEKLIEQAHKEFEQDYEYESDSREAWKMDLRFANGDPDNKFQWDASYVKDRELNKRPCLTINKVKIHNRQITNEARQNKPSVRVYPVDNGADKETAKFFNGVIRHIESNSDAETAYDMANDFAVDAGIGYWRVITDYASDDSFDQEIYIEPIKNPLNVLLDSRIQKPDGSDAKRGFIFKDMPKEEFERDYPDCDPIDWSINTGTNWIKADSIRVAEYFRMEDKKDTLYALEDGQTFKKSELEKDVIDRLEAGVMTKEVKKRELRTNAVKWYLIAGNKVLDRKDWLGKYIPIVRVIGEEKEIDGKLDRKGHTRPMKDAQRMYNYNSSASVEYGALQTKTPIIAANDAIEGFEKYWDRANTENLPYIPYNHVDEAGNPLPMPQRMAPPAPSQLFLQGMQVASNELNMSSGQYDAQFGNNPSAQSGKALNALQRKGDTATFHFTDNVARAIKYTGKILVDLIPKIYDTERIVRILGEDNSENMVKIDPNMDKSYEKRKTPEGLQEIFNPNVGRYDVAVSVGPSYTTRRQEAFDALNELASRNPKVMDIAGDIVFKSADFPMAEELAERWAKTLPPELKEQEGENAEVTAIKKQADEVIKQLQMQLDKAEQAMLEASQEANEKDGEIALKARELEIKQFEADTKRLQVELSALQQQEVIDPGEVETLKAAVAQLIQMIAPEPPEQIVEETPEPAPAGFLMPE